MNSAPASFPCSHAYNAAPAPSVADAQRVIAAAIAACLEQREKKTPPASGVGESKQLSADYTALPARQ